MLTYFIDPLEGARVLRSDGLWAINFADDGNGYAHAKQVCDELNSRETFNDILEVPQGSDSVRDQIATAAMTVLLRSAQKAQEARRLEIKQRGGFAPFKETPGLRGDLIDFQWISKESYRIADAMIAESAKQTGEKSGNS